MKSELEGKKKKKDKEEEINPGWCATKVAQPRSRDLDHMSPRLRGLGSTTQVAQPGSHNSGRTTWVTRAPGCVAWAGLHDLFLSLSDLTLSVSLIWSPSLWSDSLSVIWSDPVRWGKAVLETWEIFKIFLNYKSSLKDSIFKFSPHGKWYHIRCD